jgi:hypothetical protein
VHFTGPKPDGEVDPVKGKHSLSPKALSAGFAADISASKKVSAIP